MLTGLGHATSAEEAIARYSGLRWTDCHREIEAATGSRFDCESLGGLVDTAVEARLGLMRPIAGIDAFLRSQAGRPLAIASSSEKDFLDAMLRRLELARHFGSHVYSAARFERGKPHPDIYLHAARGLGLDPAACLVIEDHPVGAAAGAAAGMTVVGLLAASHIRAGHEDRLRAAGAHYVARDYAEVAEILGKLEAT